MTYLEDRLRLLHDLAGMGSQGRAEGESQDRFPSTFHPVSEHARAFDPDVALVTGPRGAGKTELFRAVLDCGLLEAVRRQAPNVRLPPMKKGATRWLKGFPPEKKGFDARGLRAFIEAFQGSPESMVDLWFVYLVRGLDEHLDSNARQVLSALWQVQGGDPLESHKAFLSLGQQPLLALDRLDDELQRRDAWIFVGYDELDTLGGADWSAMSVGIRGLVAFWATYTRRWHRIRAKLFLRTDLFQRYATAGGADLAKLAANRVELSWSDKNLYAMLLKRVVNTSDGLTEYTREASPKVRLVRDPDLGWVPELLRAEDARPFIERAVGPYMGANMKKGLAFRWLLDHVRDGRGQALPRPLVRLIEEASRLEIAAPSSVRPPRLLHPTSLRRALDVVSQQHVTQALDEWPWLVGLRRRLRGQQVPWERRQQVESLLVAGESTWGSVPSVRPPFEDPHDLTEYLIEVGIFRARPDGRIDVPDLFLAGLGLKRKGGVKQK
jgi:hypothetical protein